MCRPPRGLMVARPRLQPLAPRRTRGHMIDARAMAVAFVAILAASTAHARSVSIVHDAASPQASYAARKLGEALRERGYEVRSAERGAGGFRRPAGHPPGAPPGRGLRPHTVAKGARDRGRRRARPRLRRAGGGRDAPERHAPRGDPRKARGAPPRVPRREVQHSLGQLPAQLGARPALRHGARRPVLGGLSRHAGREPLQRGQPVDDAPLHLHDPAAELPRGEPVDARRARGVAPPLPRDLPPRQGARARHLRRALEHLRERGVREGARRRPAELLPALLRAGRHVRDRQALPPRERDPDARGVPRPRRLRRVAGRGHGGHDPARAPAVGRRGADRGHAGGHAAR